MFLVFQLKRDACAELGIESRNPKTRRVDQEDTVDILVDDGDAHSATTSSTGVAVASLPVVPATVAAPNLAVSSLSNSTVSSTPAVAATVSATKGTAIRSSSVTATAPSVDDSSVLATNSANVEENLLTAATPTPQDSSLKKKCTSLKRSNKRLKKTIKGLRRDIRELKNVSTAHDTSYIYFLNTLFVVTLVYIWFTS